jgi:L-fucose isomerase-like protein
LQVTKNASKNDLLIVAVASGGTERFIQTILEKHRRRIILWANPHKNSLAAALEVLACFREQIWLIYAEIAEFKQKLAKIILAHSTLCKLQKHKLGMIGKPSEWLLTSDNFSCFGDFSTKLQTVKNDELLDYQNETVSPANLQNIKNKFNSSFISDDDLSSAIKLYFKLKKLVKKNNWQGFTIRCFDLLRHKVTACLALALLNDSGITAGCEGDIPALFSMHVARLVSGMPVWMANPSQIDKKANSLLLAHCSVPTKLLTNKQPRTLVTHMESDLSVALQGKLVAEEVTLLRFGKDYTKMQLESGRVMEDPAYSSQLCRTQAKIQLKQDVERWMQASLGNHQVLIPGDWRQELEIFAQLANVTVV